MHSFLNLCQRKFERKEVITRGECFSNSEKILPLQWENTEVSGKKKKTVQYLKLVSQTDLLLDSFHILTNGRRCFEVIK